MTDKPQPQQPASSATTAKKAQDLTVEATKKAGEAINQAATEIKEATLAKVEEAKKAIHDATAPAPAASAGGNAAGAKDVKKTL